MKANGIRTGAIKSLYAEAMFNPSEEELDLPALFIELRDQTCTQKPMIRPEGQASRMLDIIDTNTAHQFRPMNRGIGAIKPNRLIRAKTRCAIDRP